MPAGKHMATMVAAALVMGGAGTNCTANGPYVHGRPPSDRGSAVTLEVRNNHWQDVRVYLLRGGGSPVRVGYVAGLSTATLRLRQPLNGSVQLLLRPLATRASFTTHVVTVEPGERLSLTVQTNLTLSSLIRR